MLNSTPDTPMRNYSTHPPMTGEAQAARDIRSILMWLVLLVCASVSLAFATAHEHGEHKLVGSHGMVVIYDKSAGFLVSHLPLYVAPHDYQIVYKISIAQSHLLLDKLRHDTVTVLPETFDLRKMLNNETFSVEATFFQGHFERGGKELFKAKIFFDQQVMAHKVKVKSENKKDSEQAVFYVAPISDTKDIAVHKIQEQPSYDAIGIINLTKEARQALSQCKNPTFINVKSITEQLALCGLTKLSYLEIQDFI